MPYTPSFLSFMIEREDLLSQIYHVFAEQFPGFSALWSSFEENAIEEMTMIAQLEERIAQGDINGSIINIEHIQNIYTFVEQLRTFSKVLAQAPSSFTFQEAVEITAYFEHFSIKQYNMDLEYVDQKEQSFSFMRILHNGFHGHTSRLKELVESSQIDVKHTETLTMTDLINMAITSQAYKKMQPSDAALSPPQKALQQGEDTSTFFMRSPATEAPSATPTATLEAPHTESHEVSSTHTMGIEELRKENERLRLEVATLKKAISVLSESF